MPLDFVGVKLYIENRAGDGYQTVPDSGSTSRRRATGLPTDYALRRSRRRNIDLRVFFIFCHSFLVRFPNIFR